MTRSRTPRRRELWRIRSEMRATREAAEEESLAAEIATAAAEAAAAGAGAVPWPAWPAVETMPVTWVPVPSPEGSPEEFVGTKRRRGKSPISESSSRVRNVVGDDNCGYRSFSVLAGQPEDTWKNMRRLLGQELVRRRAIYEPVIVQEAETFDEVLNNICNTTRFTI